MYPTKPMHFRGDAVPAPVETAWIVPCTSVGLINVPTVFTRSYVVSCGGVNDVTTFRGKGHSFFL